MGVILITGATSGIGEATARYLSKLGYSLVLMGRNETKVLRLKDAIGNCLGAYYMDLINTSNIKSVFDDIESRGIKLNGFVHSAGLEGRLLPVRSIRYEELDKLMRLHYIAFVEMGKYFCRRNISCDGASVIGVSSIAVKAEKKGAMGYACSKAAMNVAMKIMAKEFLKRRIRVNTIMPADVDTPMSSNVEEISDLEKEQPWGLIDVDQIVYLIEFLLSDKSKYITGAAIPVSAGRIY